MFSLSFCWSLTFSFLSSLTVVSSPLFSSSSPFYPSYPSFSFLASLFISLLISFLLFLFLFLFLFFFCVFTPDQCSYPLSFFRIFLAFSNFMEMHGLMAGYRIGLLTMKVWLYIIISIIIFYFFCLQYSFSINFSGAT